MVTNNRVVELQQEESIQAAVDWWVTLTHQGGEGIVVKPLDYISLHKDRIIQPAIKCRGREYLRIVYGPEYDLGKTG